MVFINEIHYDNDGADVAEGVEIAGTAGTDLSCYQIILYNGTNGSSYNTIQLTGIIQDQECGYGTIWFDISGIQNGAPDGIALYDTCNTNVIQFLSYEGTMSATSGPANGQTSSDIGVDEQTAMVGQSLQLVGTGNNYAAFTWSGSMNSTHDLVNTNQYFCIPSSGSNCGGDSSQIKLVLSTSSFAFEISW